jgi:hypothetical protein
MANLNSKFIDLASQVNFRYIQDIDTLTDSQLESHGYYKGFTCPHGHHIRDTTYHWCYECVQRIKSNICGFDINYLHVHYKHKYHSLWKQINVTHSDDCWLINAPTKTSAKRVCMPSYRSGYSQQKSENVNIHKAIYQCAWGDVGSMTVSRLCGNLLCGNPLHMISNWNRGRPPKNVSPVETEFKAEKLMLYARQLNTGKSIKPVVESQYKNTITHPLEAPEPPDYDEG